MKSLAAVSVALLLSGCGSMNSGASSNDSMSRSSMATKSIAEVAMSTGMHNTLVAALKSAGLADMLMQSGDYTVFAPTDAAFAKLPAGTVEMLMRPENRNKLRMLLQYHVVPGHVDAQHLMGMSTVKSVAGPNLTVMTMGNSVMVGNATVIKADVPASNGLVHVIDTVLMPPGMM